MNTFSFAVNNVSIDEKKSLNIEFLVVSILAVQILDHSNEN